MECLFLVVFHIGFGYCAIFPLHNRKNVIMNWVCCIKMEEICLIQPIAGIEEYFHTCPFIRIIPNSG